MLANSSHSMGSSVGARLRQARLAKKYTQNQLARPDFSVSYISAIERGQIQPSLRALEILAQRLDLSTTDLLPDHTALVSLPAGESGKAAPENGERELAFLEARIAIYQGNAAHAVEVLQRLLPPKSEKRSERFNELYYLLGWAYLALGRLQESEQFLAEAARLSKETLSPFYLSILSLQGSIYKVMHNSEQAVQLQRESLRMLAQQTSFPYNRAFLAQLHSSLAQHYSAIGEYTQAVEHFHQALNLLQAQTDDPLRQAEYSALVCTYAEKEQHLLAMLYSSKSFLTDWFYHLQDTRNEIEYMLGRVLLKSDTEQAHAYLLERAQKAEARQDKLALAGANVQIARWLIEHEQLAQAEALLSTAQEQATVSGESLVNVDISLLAGELAYKRQDYQTGDQAFERGLALLEQVGAREDLIEQFAHYAQLLEERNCIQKSLFYWKLAYESRQRDRKLAL